MANTTARDDELPELTTIEQIEAMAANGNTFSEMAVILGLAQKKFEQLVLFEGSEYNVAVKKGKLLSEFKITENLRALAESGNITGKQEFTKQLKAKKLQQLRERIYYGE